MYDSNRIETELSDDDLMTLRELREQYLERIGTGDLKGDDGWGPKVAINNSPDICRRRALFEKLLKGVK
jgi:hypothetical protein